MGALKAVAHMPLWLLYRLSDIAWPILYYLVGYRRKVVKSNLASSFPEKTDRERARIAHHLPVHRYI